MSDRRACKGIGFCGMTIRYETSRSDDEAKQGLIDPEHVAIDSVRYHTAHHASWICLDIVSRHLLENETILSHPDLYRLADQAHEVLFQLYQRFGEKLVSPETPEV